ncbi:MAG: hypothetical protein IH597_14240 [Bacteroidales bacterium]|nr:hypothetical protein [Bacteroidales bacterium]
MKNLINITKTFSLATVLIIMLGFTFNSNAQLVNPGFETGDITGWTAAGFSEASTGVTYNAWIVNPADNYMGRIIPPGGPARAGAEILLNLTAGALVAHNNGLFSSTTNFSVIYQDVLLAAGESVTMYWNFISTDYAPFNDGCFASFTGPGHQEIHVLSVTSNAYGDPNAIVVGDYGSSGWYPITLTAPAAGLYRVGFSGFNISDQILDPWVMLDNAPGGTSAPGEPIVTTVAVTSIFPPTAMSGGNVATGLNTPPITARGIVWNTTGVPTLADNFTVDGSGFGAFVSQLTGLVADQTYYVRAYATNSVDTYYGGQVSFSTGTPLVPLSDWAIYLGILLMITFVVIRFKRMM